MLNKHDNSSHCVIHSCLIIVASSIIFDRYFTWYNINKSQEFSLWLNVWERKFESVKVKSSIYYKHRYIVTVYAFVYVQSCIMFSVYVYLLVY